MKTPDEIYLFESDHEEILWCEDDQSENGNGVEYIRADKHCRIGECNARKHEKQMIESDELIKSMVEEIEHMTEVIEILR